MNFQEQRSQGFKFFEYFKVTFKLLLQYDVITSWNCVRFNVCGTGICPLTLGVESGVAMETGIADWRYACITAHNWYTERNACRFVPDLCSKVC